MDIFIALSSAILLTFTLFVIGYYPQILIFGHNKRLEVLQSLWTGLLLVVTVYAIAATKFCTVLLPILAVLLILACQNGLNAKVRGGNEGGNFKEAFRKLLYLLPWLLLLVVVQMWWRGFGNSAHFPHIGIDDSFYVTLAHHINLSGIESTNVIQHIFDTSANSAIDRTPYHYFDLWQLALLMKLVPLTGIEIFTFVQTPFIAFLVFLSFYGIVGMYGPQQKLLRHLIAFAFLFFIGYLFVSLPNIEFAKYPMHALHKQKANYAFPILAIALAQIANHKTSRALYGMPILLLINFLYVPPALFSFATLAVYVKLNEKGNWRDLLGQVAAMAIVLAWLGLLYASPGKQTFQTTLAAVNYLSFPSLKLLAASLGSKVLFFVPFHLTLLYLLFKTKNNKVLWPQLLLLASFALAGTISYFVLQSHREAGQLENYASVAAMATLSVLAFSHLSGRLGSKTDPIGKVMGYILLAFCVVQLGAGLWWNSRRVYPNGQSGTFMAQLKKNRSAIHKNGAMLLNDNERPEHCLSPHYNWYGDFIKHIDNGAWFILLNDPREILASENISESTKGLHREGVFYQLMQQKGFTDIDSARLELIRTRNLGFIYVEKGVHLSPLLEQIVTGKIEEPGTGNTLCVLRAN